jgi:hypothetical protein
MKKTLVLYIGIALTIFSCRPAPLEISLRAAPQKLVIASQVVPQTVLGVLVTRSFAALEHDVFVPGTNNVSQAFIDDVIVQNAIVTVTYAGQTDTLHPVDTIPGLYVSASVLQIPYEKYELHVYDPVLNENVNAVSTMLPGVAFDTIYPVVQEDNTVKLKYKFTDLAGPNWYLVNVYKANSSANVANLDVNSFPFNSGRNQLIQSQLINDLVYNTNDISIELNLKGVSTTDTIGVTLANISQGYYNYLSAQDKIDGIIGQLFREPVNVPTNVSNGYGYFSAYDPDVKVIDINKY